MSKIQAKAKSVRELLGNVKYGIDFYQREFQHYRNYLGGLVLLP